MSSCDVDTVHNLRNVNIHNRKKSIKYKFLKPMPRVGPISRQPTQGVHIFTLSINYFIIIRAVQSAIGFLGLNNEIFEQYSEAKHEEVKDMLAKEEYQYEKYIETACFCCKKKPAFKPCFDILKIHVPQVIDSQLLEYAKINKLCSQTDKLPEYDLSIYAFEQFYFLRKKLNIDITDIYNEFCMDDTVIGAMPSLGKSSSIFIYSNSGKYLLKEIKPSEIAVFVMILNSYCEHFSKYPKSLIIPYYFIFKITVKRSYAMEKSKYFCVMRNLFYVPDCNRVGTAHSSKLSSAKDIVFHDTYDIKGSTYSRSAYDDLRKKKNKRLLKMVSNTSSANSMREAPTKQSNTIDKTNLSEEESVNAVTYVGAVNGEIYTVIDNNIKNCNQKSDADNSFNEDSTSNSSFTCSSVNSNNDSKNEQHENTQSQKSKDKNPAVDRIQHQSEEQHHTIKRAKKEHIKKGTNEAIANNNGNNAITEYNINGTTVQNSKKYKLRKYKTVKDDNKITNMKKDADNNNNNNEIQSEAVNNAVQKKSIIKKDNDLKRIFTLSNTDCNEVIQLLFYDSSWLARHNLIDYSLIIGVADITNKNVECLNYQQYKTLKLCGKMEILYMGIIDILTDYDTRKRLEHRFKSLILPPGSKNEMSCVSPYKYQVRFQKKMMTIFKSLPPNAESESEILSYEMRRENENSLMDTDSEIDWWDVNKNYEISTSN